jgi:hypothetical protein
MTAFMQPPEHRAISRSSSSAVLLLFLGGFAVPAEPPPHSRPEAGSVGAGRRPGPGSGRIFGTDASRRLDSAGPCVSIPADDNDDSEEGDNTDENEATEVAPVIPTLTEAECGISPEVAPPAFQWACSTSSS